MICDSNPQDKYGLEDKGIKSSPAKKDLGVLVDESPDMSCAHSHEGQPYSGLYPKGQGQQGEGGDSLLLLLFGETPPDILCPDLRPPISEGHGPAEVSAEEGHEDDRWSGWSTSSVKKLGLFHLEKRRPQGELTVIFGTSVRFIRKTGTSILVGYVATGQDVMVLN